MKSLLFLLSFIVAVQLMAVDRKSILPQKFVVVSDVFSKDIPAGKCVVTGGVFSPFYFDDKQAPLPAAIISTLDRKKYANTDSEGKFKLVLESTDTSIFMYSEGYEEIVIWKYLFRSQHLVTINFYPSFNDQMYEVDKPVIYLYSDNEVKADISLNSKSSVTFTYPEYQNGWAVKVNEEGVVDLNSGKKYPYLFWEGETQKMDFIYAENGMEGFIINTDTVVSFLENSLSAMGFNSTEQTDFITFWAPRMIAEPFAVVQFYNNENYANYISDMKINPEPDAMLRVYMLFQPLKSLHYTVNLKPQKFEPFERKGFTVIEWGGTELIPLIQVP